MKFSIFVIDHSEEELKVTLEYSKKNNLDIDNKIVEKYDDIKLIFINEYEDERPYFKIKVENNVFILDDEGISDIESNTPIPLKVLKNLANILEEFHEIVFSN